MQEKLAAPAEFTLADLFETYEAGLRRYARFLTADSDWADDLVSETLLKSMSYLNLLSQMHPSQRRAWLNRVLKNQFLDNLRSQKRESRLAKLLAENETDLTPVEEGFLLDGSIPAHHREVLFMRYAMGMTSEKIGQNLGVPSATIRSRLRLAKEWLKKHQDQGD